MKTTQKQLFLSNTLTRTKEVFVPLDKKLVKIYSCGPTVYRDVHVGNMRAFHYADLLNKVIKHILWLPTKHVMNLTDVWHLKWDGDKGEDKMEIWAKRDNLTARQLADRYIAVFFDAIESMRLTAFDDFPRATDYIQEQIDMIATLQKKWYTYDIQWDGIYMNTAKVKNYGALAQLDKQEQQAGARIDDSAKKRHTDFALWKYSKPDEKRHMERNSPRWVWYPWWHIECSAMATALLWDRFDIHTWWDDHIWVHHPNEIAQTECCTWHKRVNYRLHNQMLNLWWKKMAKSEWGLITVRKLEDLWYDALDLKYLFSTWHYKNFLERWAHNQDVSRLDESRKARLKLNNALQPYLSEKDFCETATYETLEESLTTQEAKNFLNNISDSFLDDLNSCKALSLIHPAIKDLTTEKARVILWSDMHILMLWISDKVEKKESDAIPAHIQELAQSRLDAKNNKDRATADVLRYEIIQAGFDIKDTKDGFEIEKTKPALFKKDSL